MIWFIFFQGWDEIEIPSEIIPPLYRVSHIEMALMNWL